MNRILISTNQRVKNPVRCFLKPPAEPPSPLSLPMQLLPAYLIYLMYLKVDHFMNFFAPVSISKITASVEHVIWGKHDSLFLGCGYSRWVLEGANSRVPLR